jgi:hypothetical protein
MNLFTSVYTKARDVAIGQRFAEPDWQKFMAETCSVKVLFGAKGFDTTKADAPDKVRNKVADKAKTIKLDHTQYIKKTGKVIFEAAQNTSSTGAWTERAALMEFLRHLYRAHKTGAQDVWVYSPARYLAKHVFDEFTGPDDVVKKKLGRDAEIFSAKERQLMCNALSIAKKIAADACVKLGAKKDATKEVVRRWFLDEDSTDAALEESINKLTAGFKTISASCGSTTLVFTDYIDWRKERKKYFDGAIRGGEGGGFPVIYLEGAFTRLVGNSGKLWLCAETIIHELSHHDVSTQDHQYDHEGLKPKKASFPYAKAIDNADSWGYFAIDLAGYLSSSDRTKTLK